MQIRGKIIINAQIETVTGLHIGGASTGLEIGGVDKVVVRRAIDNTPYIPGSSLKGKLRTLLERGEGFAEPSKRVWVKHNEISMHLCDKPECFLCNIFGRNNGDMTPVEGDRFEIRSTTPTRLTVRDAELIKESLAKAQTELPFTEVKWEVGIDRITSQANPRQMERVPAGAVFCCEMIYSVFDKADGDNLKYVLEAMGWLEDDYLGGQGSRGSGKVAFRNLRIDWRPAAFYKQGDMASLRENINEPHVTVSSAMANFDEIRSRITYSEDS